MTSTQFRPPSKWLRAAAARMLIATAAVSLIAGCGDDDTTNNVTSGSVDQINTPTGTVLGTVQDTNGQPIQGATVEIGNRSVTTGAGGGFEIEDVAVTNTQGNTNQANATTAQFIPLTVTPPMGFAGATVTVNPEAQVFGEQPAPAAGDSNGSDNPVLLFVDGYTASVGTVRLPALTTTVTGTLRSSQNGQGIGGEPVSLDFGDISIDNNGNAGAGAGANAVGVSYAVGLVTGTTAADGTFTFTSVPDDSCFVLRATNFVLAAPTNGTPNQGCDGAADGVGVGSGTLISTTAESDQTVNLAQVTATPLNNEDRFGPYVTSVSDVPVQNIGGVSGNAGNRATLSNGVDGTGGITVRFSEPVAANLSDSDLIVVVTNASGDQQAVPATLVVNSATEVEVTTAAPIGQGVPVTIYIRAQSLVDANGNPPMNNPPAGSGPVAANNPTFDNANAAFAGQTQLGLFLTTFADTNTVADAVNVTQVVAQDATIGTPNANQTTAALVDTIGNGLLTQNGFNSAGANVSPAAFPPLADGDIQNVNAEQLANSMNSPDLFTNLVENILFGAGQTWGGVLRVNVSIPAASTNPPANVLVSVQRGNNLLPLQGVFPVNDSSGSSAQVTGTSAVAGSTQRRVVVNPAGLGSFDLVILGANNPPNRLRDGDTLIVQSQSASGTVSGNPTMIPIVDGVQPTASAQILAGQAGAAAGGSSGVGGGVIAGNSNSTQIFVFPVTPQALDSDDSNPGFEGDDLQGELAGNSALTQPAAAVASVLADATSTAPFLANGQRRLGLSVTEPLDSNLPGTPAFNGTAALSNFLVQNNVTVEGPPFAPRFAPPMADPNAGSLPTRNNLVSFDVDDVFTLEADGRAANRMINLTGAIADENGNTATNAANARLLVQDRKPPFVTRAFYDAQNIVVDFDESVRLQGNLTLLDCVGGPQDINLQAAANNVPGANQATLTAGNTRVTIPVANAQVPAGISNCFDLTLSYAETAYTAANLGSLTSLPAGAIDPTPAHGRIEYRDVPDRAANNARGTAFPNNTWVLWEGQNLGVNRPQFAAANIIGPFAPVAVARANNFASAGANQGAAGDTVNVNITFNQPFFITDSVTGDPRDDFDGADADEDGPGNNDGVLSQAELVAWAAGKFEYFDATAAAALAATDVQVLDNNNQDITTTSGNDQQAATVILTFTLNNAVAGGDRVRMVAGSTLTSQFDTSNNTLVFPFDESTGQPQGAGPAVPGDGTNQREELQAIRPLPAGLTCPQAGNNGGAGSC